MAFVSDFADQAVMLPMSVAVLALLGVLGWWRGMGAWLVAVGGTFAIILVLKAGLFVLADNFGSDYQVSPSGHVAAACVVYGGLAVLLLRGLVPGALIAVVPVLAILVVGISRVALGAHTIAEVLEGAAVGAIGVITLASTAGARPRIVAWPLAAVGGCMAVALHGMHMPAEQAIRHASQVW